MPTYQVRYPSGRSFEITGRFILAPLANWILPIVILPDDQYVALDQRAIVTKDNDKIYSPRRNLDGLQKEMREWLAEHPEWAA